MARRAVSKSEQEEVIKLISKHIESQKEYEKLSDMQFNKAVEDKIKEYNKYWKECIIMQVG